MSNVTLSSATYSPGQNLSKFVEHFECPEGYLGQFCESCAPGYHRDPLNGGPFGTCIPCNCNEHSEICDAETGSFLFHHFQTIRLYEFRIGDAGNLQSALISCIVICYYYKILEFGVSLESSFSNLMHTSYRFNFYLGFAIFSVEFSVHSCFLV